MTALPWRPCRHRVHDPATQQPLCTSPLVVLPSKIVQREICERQCPYVDHEPHAWGGAPHHSAPLAGNGAPSSLPRPAPLATPAAADPPRHRPRPTVRNCLYAVCPLPSNDVWRQNVRQLLRRVEAFNGRRVAAIACGPGLAPPDEVRRAFDGAGFSFLELPNDIILREVVSFLPLLLSVASCDPQQATFYAHTKGNSTADNRQGAMYWRNAAYHHLLDRWDECMSRLQDYACCGIHKMVWPADAPSPYPSRLRHGQWMFAGTFFWFRNDAVFSHPAWRSVPMDRYGAEAYLAGLFDEHQAHSMYQCWPELQYPVPNPYNPDLYPDPIPDDPLSG